MSLAACASNPKGFATLDGVPGKSGGGACSAFPRPEYAIKGATNYDQRWADKTTEAGVAGCRWKRPQARPASFDEKPIAYATPTASPTAVPVKKRRWYNIFRRKPSEAVGG